MLGPCYLTTPPVVPEPLSSLDTSSRLYHSAPLAVHSRASSATNPFCSAPPLGATITRRLLPFPAELVCYPSFVPQRLLVLLPFPIIPNHYPNNSLPRHHSPNHPSRHPLPRAATGPCNAAPVAPFSRPTRSPLPTDICGVLPLQALSVYPSPKGLKQGTESPCWCVVPGREMFHRLIPSPQYLSAYPSPKGLKQGAESNCLRVVLPASSRGAQSSGGLR